MFPAYLFTMHLVALIIRASATPTAPVGAGAAVYGSPGFWLAAAAAFGGLLLIIGDTVIRWKSLAAQAELAGAAKRLADASIASQTMASTNANAPDLGQSQEQVTEAIKAYEKLFLKHPQLVAGVTLLVIPVLVVGGVSFGSTS
ncbi:hypothetical protein NQ156_01815 [Microbacterium sp. zg.Y625]|uniref:hypothetical protein n=1 Tax=Microbacterium jiangjiandongii TaxID=3049071 RepID=UPI00214BF163|nr:MULTISPECIES: hypothetical protein [unclassified Microbacterium]MCR2791796.1 hypothetical protein [Microbacterium sp. zg.Y625]WIM24613.1 hypothetical protein QNO14_10725 [Microbacterium sp. zg-Y625]